MLGFSRLTNHSAANSSFANSWFRSQAVLALFILASAAHSASAQSVDPAKPASQLPHSDVPLEVQNLRWHMLDPGFNSLAFRSMDTLFTTRKVPHSGPAWQLARADHPLDFTYTFEGKTYHAEDFFDRTYTNALLIMKNGVIVSETYRNYTDDQTHFIAWSATKSYIGTLVGNALAEGRIKSLDDDISSYLTELKGGGYEGVTIRQVLQMRSGVEYEERYDFSPTNPSLAARNHENALIKNVARFADVARTIRRAHKPGEVFAYKTLDTAVLGWLVERVAGETVSAYMTRKIWEPIGAEADGFFIMDGPPGVGREFTGAGFNATVRDFARFGQMVLDGGEANGHRIVSSAWLKEATTSTFPAQGPMGYGYQWWTFTNSHAFTALGLQGQYIFVDPSTKTVVVKVSYFPPTDTNAERETAAFLMAASAWTPNH
jgi:CubicO group peptidase (beta-lactamase class C family)